MARENRTWGAKRIRGELLKLGMRVAKSTIQRYIKQVHYPGSSQQTWRTFIHNHASEIWACDILQTYDLFFRELFVFVIIELGTRRIVHFGVTRHPTDRWLAQQLREATPFGAGPRFLIRDNDRKYGTSFSRVAFGAGIDVLRTPYRAPKANAICERFLGRSPARMSGSLHHIEQASPASHREGIYTLLQLCSSSPRDRPADSLPACVSSLAYCRRSGCLIPGAGWFA